MSSTAGRPSRLPSVDVLAIFGPTASGKTAVAEAIAERIPAELVSADSMQVYRGLPILTNQDAGARLVGIWPLDRQGTVGEFQALAHEAIDEIVAAGRTAVVVGGSGLWFQAALTDVRLPADVPQDARARWERLYDRRGAGDRARRCCRRAIPAPPRRCTRTTASASCGRSSSGRRAERSCPSSRGSGRAELRLPTLVVGPRGPARDRWRHGSARAPRRCSSRGWRRRCGPQATSFPRCSASTPSGGCPRAEAIAELDRATLRFAAYQRKWMRRIPGIVMIDADRPVGEVADAILEVARAR